MIDLSLYCNGLEFVSEGVWTSTLGWPRPLSYPRIGHEINGPMENASFWYAHRARCILKAIKNLPPSGAVFDLGGGTGMVTEILKSHQIMTVLIEPDPVAIKLAKARGISPIIQADLENLNFKPGTVPAFGMFDVLEHIENDLETLSSLRQGLKDGGRIYLTVPAGAWLWSEEDVKARHFRRYSKSQLKTLLTSAGLQIEYLTAIFSLMTVPVFVARRLPYLLKIKRSDRQYQKELSVHKDKILPWLEWEELRVANCRSIPFGSSWLAVARK